jgi:hypothetical protein
MMRCTVEQIAFDEPDLTAAVPSCVGVVAAMLMCGFRLKSGPNHEDVILGCERLPQFKDAKRARLRREVRWHFVARPRPVRLLAGETMTPGQFLNRWNEDVVMRHLLTGHEKYREWLDAVSLKTRAVTKLVLAAESSRVAYAKLTGQTDPKAAAAMHNFMENGGI